MKKKLNKSRMHAYKQKFKFFFTRFHGRNEKKIESYTEWSLRHLLLIYIIATQFISEKFNACY